MAVFVLLCGWTVLPSGPYARSRAIRWIWQRVADLRDLLRGKARQIQLAALTPCLHLGLSRLGAAGIKPAPLLHIGRLRGEGKVGACRGDDVHDAQIEVLGDLQVLAEVAHGDVAEHLEVQRRAAEVDEANPSRGRVDLG